MIAAGVAAYRDRDSRIMRDCDIVEEIFMAMMLQSARTSYSWFGWDYVQARL